MNNDLENKTSPSGQTVTVNNFEKKTNSMGTTGFVLSLIAIFVGWAPILGWVIWLLGLIFSAIGMSRTPKGLAIAGLIISLIGIILLLVVFSAFVGASAFL